MLDEGVDLLDQVFHAAERAPADGALGDQTEPARYLIQPRGIGGRVVEVVARPLCQPSSYSGMLVSGVVVDDEMNVEILRHAGIEAAEEGEKLLMPVAGLAFGEDGAGGDVEGSKQRGGTVADVIVGDAFPVAQSHGQHGRGAVQGLNLAFFVHAQHQGVLGRVQIEANDIPHFLDKLRS